MTAGVSRVQSSNRLITESASDVSAPERGLLRALLEAYWLRPENALWMFLRSVTLRRIEIQQRSLDVSCGDGVFMFLHLGGRFAPEFDVFSAVGALDQVRDEHADMFDFQGDYRPDISTRPGHPVDVGCDLKPNLLAKATRLGLYRDLVQTDNNLPLPFPADRFQTIYCNAAYWVEKIDPFLGELRRIARPGGRVVLQVKLESMREFTLEAYRSVLGERFLDIIGRGRLDCWPTLADRATWESRFARAGLRIEDASPFVTRTHAHLWDIGLRPLAPLLVRMANAITPQTRAAIKRDWVDLWSDLLAPFAKPEIDLYSGPAEPAEIQYVLSL